MSLRDLGVFTLAYGVLADINNQWDGRDSAGGQGLLCEMRDTIARVARMSAQDVQDNHGFSMLKHKKDF